MTSKSRSRVICVPFPGAGHAVNMFNVAHVLATPQIPVHVLVMSAKEGRKWSLATGQVQNPDVHLEIIADGKWEDWRTEDPKDLVGQIQSDAFTQAISDKIGEIKNRFSSDKLSTMVFNALMAKLVSVFKHYEMKGLLLMPVPYYMQRLMAARKDGDTPDTEVIFEGIGGSDRAMSGKMEDFMDMFGPMGKLFYPVVEATDGSIASNTNSGLEGPLYKQPNMNHNGIPERPTYFIGPLLPPWLEHGLDRPELLKQKEKEAATDECIQFMNRQKDKSVVYIALGSHVTLLPEQAKLIIANLRRHHVPWVLLFREGTKAMQEALGGTFDDGVVTSWAPQVEIMVHPALKCVISHGGFGTMIEGVFAGAPFITAPRASDQYLDTKVMMHLGICLGCIAENKRLGVMDTKVLHPFFPEDGGKAIEELFTRVFGSEQGEKDLEAARIAARDLRRRMLDAKAKEGAEHLEKLRQTIKGVA